MTGKPPADTWTDFYQQPPVIGNQYRSDAGLQAWLLRVLPEDIHGHIEPGLDELGQLACDAMPAMAEDAEQHPPELIRFDPWGRRIDRIQTARGWQQLHGLAAREAIVATGYQRRHQQWSRLHQFARLYLYHPSSAVASCPLAMTDGAARLLELYAAGDWRDNVLAHLTATDPEMFWTAGQWMTERTGGSDVSMTSTVAEPAGDGAPGAYRLYGDKWFTSAVTAEVAMTLARIREQGRTDERLSLFFLDIHDAGGRLNRITIHRLKDKLGTRALPTAELTLNGSRARLIGERGRGVGNIATMLNITRMYNACCAAAIMRRALVLAEDYAGRRKAFGRLLKEQPLHVETLADMRCEQRGALALVMHLALLMGRQECGESNAGEDRILRLLIPVAKLYTGKQAVGVTSEALECFGGAGYVEDTGLPVLLRDTQVLSIWEGTTNVLSLDVLRALGDESAWPALHRDLKQRLRHGHEELAAETGRTAGALDGLHHWLQQQRGDDELQRSARRLGYALARVSGAVLLLEHAAWSLAENRDRDAVDAARRWCRQDLLAGLGL